MKDYRVKIVFNDGGSVSFTVHHDSFHKAVKSAISSYPADLQRRIVSINVEDFSL